MQAELRRAELFRAEWHDAPGGGRAFTVLEQAGGVSKCQADAQLQLDGTRRLVELEGEPQPSS